MAKEKPQMQQVWFRAPAELVKWLEEEAAKLTVSVSDFLRMKLLGVKNGSRR